MPPFVSQKEGLARPRPHVLLPEASPRRGGAAPGPANPDSMVHQRTATLGSKNEGVAGHPTIRDAPSELGFHSSQFEKGTPSPESEARKSERDCAPLRVLGLQGGVLAGDEAPAFPGQPQSAFPSAIYSLY